MDRKFSWAINKVPTNGPTTKQFVFASWESRARTHWPGPDLTQRSVTIPDFKMQDVLWKLYNICVELKLDHGDKVFYVDWSHRVLYSARTFCKDGRYGLADVRGHRV